MSGQQSDQIRLLQIGTFLLLIGKAWQHLVWNDKLVYKVYDEFFIKWFMEHLLNKEWKGFLIDNSINPTFLFNLKIIGLFLLAMAIIVAFIDKLPRYFHYTLFLIPIYYLPVVLSQLASNYGLYHAPIELMIQIGIPIALFMSLRSQSNQKRFRFFLKFIVATTFLAHGLFAIYLFPMPQSFITMTRNVMDISTVDAIRFLKVVGWIDIICAVLIFLPRMDVLVTGYVIIWGFFTAMARFFGTPYYGDLWIHINRWSPEFLVRICHFVLPIALLLVLLKHYSKKNEI